MIPTTSLAPEGAPRPLKTSWLSLRGWGPLFVGNEKIVATMVAAMSSRWRPVDDLKRAGGGRRRRRMQGQGSGNVYAWRAGGGRHDQRGGASGQGKVSRKRMTGREGGGGGRHEASGQQTTQQEGCHCGSGTWWNPPVRVSANINAIACQLQSRQEKEGQGPIIIEAGEQSSTMTRMLQSRTTATTALSSLRWLHWGRRHSLRRQRRR